MESTENTIPLLLYPIVACAAISADHAENTISLLLFMGHCIVTAIV
jgi:hypothetical protein